MAAAAAIHPSLSFHVFSTVEPLRADFVRLESPAYPFVRFDEPPQQLLRKSAASLEMLRLIFGVWEIARARGVSWLALSPAFIEAIEPELIERLQLDPEQVAAEFFACFGPPPSPPPQVVEPSPEALSRALRSALEQIPIEQLEALAARYGLEPTAHRCRVAYDELRAFARRVDPGQQEQLRVAGEAFARGALSVEEVATLLGVHPVDAAALLESHGYYRSLDVLTLSDDARSEHLARIRRDRLARAGRPAATVESIGRDTVASERIEGIDARRWISRSGA